MKAFNAKISYQRKVLSAVNSFFSVEEQLPGLAEGTLDRWLKKQDSGSAHTLAIVLRDAAKLTASLDEFSAPIAIDIKATKENIDQLCERIQVELKQIRDGVGT